VTRPQPFAEDQERPGRVRGARHESEQRQQIDQVGRRMSLPLGKGRTSRVGCPRSLPRSRGPRLRRASRNEEDETNVDGPALSAALLLLTRWPSARWRGRCRARRKALYQANCAKVSRIRRTREYAGSKSMKAPSLVIAHTQGRRARSHREHPRDRQAQARDGGSEPGRALGDRADRPRHGEAAQH